MSQADLTHRWATFRGRPFPDGCRGEEINGVCVTSLDSFAAGCISTFLGTHSLDAEQIAILRGCRNDLETILPALDGEPGAYFEELASLTDDVLAKAR